MEKVKKLGVYPSPFVDFKTKQSKEWCLAYVKQFYQESQGDPACQLVPVLEEQKPENDRRAYCRGKQDENIYKNWISPRRKKGRQYQTWRNLRFKILPVVPRFIELLMGKIMKQDMTVQIKAIDPLSVSEELLKQQQMQEYMINKKLLDQVEQNTGVQFERPIANDSPLPNSIDEIPQYNSVFFKNKLTSKLTDLFNQESESLNIQQLDKEVLRDLIEVGIGGQYTWLDSNGKPRVERIIPEQTRKNRTKYPDHRDLSQIGFVMEVTISKLREMWPEATEEQLIKIANTATSNTNRSYNINSLHYYREYFNQNYSYPYDDIRVNLFIAEWESQDELVSLLKPDAHGNKKKYTKRSGYAKNVDPSDYKKQNPDRDIIRKRIANWYKATWVIGTDHIFNFGVKTNMLRQASNLEDAKSGFVLYQMESVIADWLIPIADSIQLDWLYFQHHRAHEKPDGIAIEYTAFENIKLSKAGGTMDPADLIDFYLETGSQIYRRKHRGGTADQTKPIEPLQNPSTSKADARFKSIIATLDLLRFVLGLSQVNDGTIQSAEIGKSVSEMAMSGHEETINNLISAFLHIKKNVASNLIHHIQDSIAYYGGERYRNALGMDTVSFMDIVKDMHIRELSAYIEVGPDDKEKAIIEQEIQKSLDQQLIDPEDARILRHDNNPYRVALYLKKKRQEKQEAAGQAEEATFQRELAKNTESTMASANADIMRDEAKHNYTLKELETKSKLKINEGIQETLNKIKVLEAEKANKLQEQSEKHQDDKEIKKMELAKQNQDSPKK